MTTEAGPLQFPDFEDTQIAFENRSDKELRKIYWMFRLMNNPNLVSIGSSLTRTALSLNLPLVQVIVKKTIFEHFCGGAHLENCQGVIDHLYQHNTLTVLDYGAESKSKEEDLELTKKELLKAIEFAAANQSVPVISSKLTALADNDILIKKQSRESFNRTEESYYDNFLRRIDEICRHAYDLGVGVFIDAEESWMQETMDEVVNELMERYNKEKVIVYNTYQLYRNDKLAQLKADYGRSLEKGYLLGAKLVRGAYMEKEREVAEEQGYPSPIHESKEATDKDFDDGIIFCVERYERLAVCCASHNLKSNLLLAKEVIKRNIPRNHNHINFCQLQGMSDNITFNLAKAGFNVAKYVVYGPLKEVVDYLIRRAEENSSVQGGLSRELQLVRREMQRRGLL